MSWLKKKYSGIFTNNMFSSANEETADFIRVRTVLSLSAISFCLFWFVSHDFNFYHLFRKVDYFAEFVENYHNKSDVFSSSCTSFSVFFSKDSSWDSLFLLLDRCLMIIKLLLQLKLSTTFQLSRCDHTATGNFSDDYYEKFLNHFF